MSINDPGSDDDITAVIIGREDTRVRGVPERTITPRTPPVLAEQRCQNCGRGLGMFAARPGDFLACSKAACRAVEREHHRRAARARA
jgi:hypothetical protein